MLPVMIKPDIYWVGVNDRLTDLFEGIWPIQDVGISYNSYLVKDQKNAVIDLVKASYIDDFIAQISQFIELSQLDYIIINHMEPDHTGAVRILRQLAPQATIIGTEKTKKMLAAYYEITENVRVVGDMETISLGKHTLQFISTPFVHWPETMMTYDLNEEILFSCDGFGSYGALNGTIFEDNYNPLDKTSLKENALRYYANIVAQFNKTASKAVSRLADVPVSIIAPSHGPVWQKNLQEIIAWYKQWISYASGPAETGVTLIYASMYRNTEKMMEAVAQGIAGEGVHINLFDAERINISFILPSLLTQQGVMIGAPTYEGGLFPLSKNILDMAGEKKVGPKQAAFFGSYGWGIGAREQFVQRAETLGWKLFDLLVFNGMPTKKDLDMGIDFGARFAQSLK
jgi:anaerobic nitric oxide reductase flavorubredoxin